MIMDFVKGKIAQATARHLLGFAGAYLVSKGLLSADLWGSIQPHLSEIIFGGVLGSGALAASLVDKVSVGASFGIPPTLPQQPVDLCQPPITPKPPKGYTFSDRSLGVLSKVHPDLQRVFKTAIISSPHDFVVYHGLRTAAEQEEMVRAGASWVTHSKHQDGFAVDIYLTFDGGKTAYWGREETNGISVVDQREAYRDIADHIQSVGDRLGVEVIWGGDWKGKVDMVHFELA